MLLQLMLTGQHHVIAKCKLHFALSWQQMSNLSINSTGINR